jgi:hypothetical protein
MPKSIKPASHPPGDKSVIYLNTNTLTSCQACNFSFNDWYDLGKQIQHYIEHGYKVIHVGQETSRDNEGNPWQSTVAVLKL